MPGTEFMTVTIPSCTQGLDFLGALTNFFPTYISDISEPHGDLLHWNLSWAFTYNISVDEEGSAPEKYSIRRQQSRKESHIKIKDIYRNFILSLNNKFHIFSTSLELRLW